MAVTWTFTLQQLVTLVLAMVGIGAIGLGIPAGYWLRGLPVPHLPARDVELGEVADALDQAAAVVREHATAPPPR